MEGKFSLAWDHNTEPDLAGYRVYLYSPDPSRSNAYACLRRTVTVQSRLTISAISGTEYIFRVTALDTSGNESAMSERLPFTYSSTAGQVPSEQGEAGDAPQQSGSGPRSGSGTLPGEQVGPGRW
jgi:hypothetical protein